MSRCVLDKVSADGKARRAHPPPSGLGSAMALPSPTTVRFHFVFPSDHLSLRSIDPPGPPLPLSANESDEKSSEVLTGAQCRAGRMR